MVEPGLGDRTHLFGLNSYFPDFFTTHMGIPSGQNTWLNWWVIILFLIECKILDNLWFSFPSRKTEMTINLHQTNSRK